MPDPINITALCPWDLTLGFGGKNYATSMPTWADTILLRKGEQALQSLSDADPEELAQVDGMLREGLKRFFPREVWALVDAAKWDEVVAAYAVAGAYYGEWLKKKQETALEAGRIAAGWRPPPAPPAAAGPPAKPTPGRGR